MGWAYHIGFLLSWSGLALHPFHVSVCEVVYNDASAQIEIVQRIFLDDLEQGLQTHYQWPWLDIMAQEHADTLDVLIEGYCQAHIQLFVNHSALQWQYLGHEIKDQHLWVYGEAPFSETPTRLCVQSSLLTKRIPEQINIVHIQVRDTWHSFRLHRHKNLTEWVHW